MYEAQSYETILQRLLDKVPSDMQKSEGSFIYDALAPAALELAQAYVQLNNVLNLGFASTASGQYLDYRATEHGINRKPAVQAGGQVKISGVENTVIPAGTIFATAGGLRFVTGSEALIGASGEVTVSVMAEEAGLSGNVPAGAINRIPVALAGVAAVTNPAPTMGGTDEENDADLLTRLLARVREPATSGNISHYKQWALEVPGVGDARVLATWNGPGTVKVVVIDSNKEPAGAQIVAAVAAHISEVRPIGADVTVASADGLPIDAATTLTLFPGADMGAVEDAFHNALASYLRRIAFQQSYVSHAQVGTLILGIPGVMDYTGLTLNGGTSNIAVSDIQVAVKGTVTLHE